MRKRILTVLLACCCLVLAGGCVNIQQDMTIGADGSVDCNYAVMGGQMFQRDLQAAKGQLGADSVEDMASEDGRLRGFKAAFHADKLADMPDKLQRLQIIDGKTYRVEQQHNWFYDRYQLTFSKDGNGNRFLQQGQRPQARQAAQRQSKMAGEPEYAFTMQLPVTSEATNADTISADGKTLSWDLAENFYGDDKAVQVQFRLWQRMHLAIAGIVLLIFVLGAVACFLQLRSTSDKRWQQGCIACLLLAVAVAGVSVYQLKKVPEITVYEATKAVQGGTDNIGQAPEQKKPQAAKPAQTKKSPNSLETDTVTSEDEADGKVRTPQVHLADADAEERINQDIKTAMAQKFATERQLKKHERSFDVTCDNDAVLSLVIQDRTYYEGAAHGNTVYLALTYDKQTGARKTTGDYAQVDAARVLDLAVSGLKHYAGCRGGGQMNPNVNMFSKEPPLDNLYLDQEGHAWLLFNPYVMGPYVDGATCLQLPES